MTETNESIEPVEFALTNIHGPAGRGDVVLFGERIPDRWPTQFRSELREHGAVSTEQPELPAGQHWPPRPVDLDGHAERKHIGTIG